MTCQIMNIRLVYGDAHIALRLSGSQLRRIIVGLPSDAEYLAFLRHHHVYAPTCR